MNDEIVDRIVSLIDAFDLVSLESYPSKWFYVYVGRNGVWENSTKKFDSKVEALEDFLQRINRVHLMPED